VLMFGFALIPAAIFVELVQNPKTIISDAGISLDATLLLGSIRIGWNEITAGHVSVVTLQTNYQTHHPGR
jgi:hypothetical protein